MSALTAWPMALGSLALAGIFATLHMALLHSARTTLAEMALERHHPAAQRRIDDILADLEGHALGQGLLASVCSLLAALGFIAWVGGSSGSVARLDIVLGLVISAPSLWLVTVVVPASLADHAGERLVYSAASLIRITYRLSMPLVLLWRGIEGFVRSVIVPTTTQAQAIEADLLSVVEEGRQEGQFDEQERDMIAAVVRLRTTNAQDVMTPRTDIDALQYTDNLSTIKAFVRQAPHSRIPVYDDNLDHVVGILYAKDLLHYLAEHDGTSESFVLEPLLRKATFVPESKTVRELLADLLERQTHMALIADEYGGTAGLVTVEDIIEEVFGDILDEYETPEDEAPSIDLDPDSNSADIDARAHIDDLNEALEPLGVSLPESDDYDTLGGCIMVRLGRIPERGEQLRVDNTLLEVTHAEPTRVLRVHLRVLPKDTQEPSAPPSSERAHTRTED